MDELGFPWWIRVEHFAFIIFVTFLIRSGIEILGSYPKLHRKESTPVGGQWAQFAVKEMRKHKYFASSHEYDDYSPLVSLPGNALLGQGRYWHFIAAIGYIVFAIAYYVLLLATGQWRRYIPTSWDVFAQAFDDFVHYLAFQIPEAMPGMPFNAIQQLSYGFIVLILPLFMILTGLLQSPAIANHWPGLTRALGSRQVIRTLHFLGLAVYVVFIVVHVALVVAHGYGHEVSKMTFGDAAHPVAGGVIFTAGLVFVVFLHIVATRSSITQPKQVEKLHNATVRPLTRPLLRLPSRQQIDDSRISADHRAAGMPPSTEEYMAMAANGYEDDFVLEIGGLVERPMSLRLSDLREIAAGNSQTTLLHCVQGFSSVGKWSGVPLYQLLELARPLDDASDVAVLCFQNMTRDDDVYEGAYYYETMPMQEAAQPQTLIAIGLNDDEIPMQNGAPCRLRLETSTAFRSAKWIERIEVVNRYDIIGDGNGGYFEDIDFYDRVQTI